MVVPCAGLGWRLFLFENTPYFLSEESNKDRDNRDENHKEIHLGLLIGKSTHTPNSISKKKKAQAPKRA